MSAVAPERASSPASTDGPDIAHLVYCCNEDLAICGTDVTEEPWCTTEDDWQCVVCTDLWADDFCPRCGCEEC